MASVSRTILLTGISTLALASPALAQQAATPGPAVSTPTTPDPESTIVVTGTRRTDRTVADSPVPIDVIGSEAITNTGATETNKILNQLVPSFNFPQPAIADGSDALRPATLRGLSPDQTLVLINGKRRHVAALLNINGTVGRGSAAVDLNLVPGLAISRIEVLRDGASSQYGSDAIAGVINIQLKKANHGGRASVTYGKYVSTLDNVSRVTGLQLNAAGQPQLDPLDNRYLLANTNGDRRVRDGAQLTTGINVGLPIGAGGYVNLTGEYRDRDATNRQAYDLRPNYIRPSSTTFDPREANFNRLNFRFGDPATKDFNLFVNTGYEFDGGWELYGFGSYGHRNSESAANFRQQSNAANRDFSTLTPSTTPMPNTANPFLSNFVALTPDGFLPLIDTKLRDYAATVGLRGELGGWTTDVSVGRGHNKFDYQINDSLNTSFGPASQTSFDAGGLWDPLESTCRHASLSIL